MKPLQTGSFYLLWIVSSALTVLDWITLRSGITGVAAVLAKAIPMEWQIEHQWYARWTVRAVDPCAAAILTILALMSIISFDYLYHDAIEKGKIKKRFGTVTAIQAGLLIVSAIATLVSSAFA
jgi:sterol desaturase/sphingolipid hydroxylase (fatty acid hydroxylase superfamily)